jgi:hypothetical protein
MFNWVIHILIYTNGAYNMCQVIKGREEWQFYLIVELRSELGAYSHVMTDWPHQTPTSTAPTQLPQPSWHLFLIKDYQMPAVPAWGQESFADLFKLKLIWNMSQLLHTHNGKLSIRSHTGTMEALNIHFLFWVVHSGRQGHKWSLIS